MQMTAVKEKIAPVIVFEMSLKNKKEQMQNFNDFIRANLKVVLTSD